MALRGLRLLELGSFIAGPHCASILGSFGAEVIKIEPPGGDQLRKWRELDESGTSFWWYSLARNKQSVCIDLHSNEGRELIRRLIPECDVLVENFRPGRMEEWGLGPDAVAALNPGLIFTRVSGYGQTGPYARRPGFASGLEAVGGFRFLNGFPGHASVRPNLSLGDTLAGEKAALGTLIALLAKERKTAMAPRSPADHEPPLPQGWEKFPGPRGRTIFVNHHAKKTQYEDPRDAGGQVVDVSILESVFGMLEGVLPDYSGNGVVRGPSGSAVTGVVPSGTYRCGDGRDVVIGANTDSLFIRLCSCVDRSDMAEDTDRCVSGRPTANGSFS